MKVLSTHGLVQLIELIESKTQWIILREITLITQEMQSFTHRKLEISLSMKQDSQHMNSVTSGKKWLPSTYYRRTMHIELKFLSSNPKDKLLEVNFTYSEVF